MSKPSENEISQLLQEKDPIRKANLFKAYIDNGLRMTELARVCNLSASYICNYLRLLKLPVLVTDGYYSQLISTTHLFIIARLHSEDSMINVYEKVLSESLSTAQTEIRVRQILYALNSDGEHISKDRIETLKKYIQDIDPESECKLVQTRRRIAVTISKKGSLADTTQFFNSLILLLSSEDKDLQTTELDS